MMLRPSVVNALVPELVGKVVFPGILVSGSLLLVSYLASLASSIPLFGQVASFGSSWVVHVVIWTVLLIPFFWAIIVLSRTVYRFEKSSVTREFSLVSVRRLTVPYDKIVQIKLKISVWDRISGAGNVVVHTAEDTAPDMVLRHVPNPRKVESLLIGKMQ